MNPTCNQDEVGSNRVIGMIIDPQNQIGEANENNNGGTALGQDMDNVNILAPGIAPIVNVNMSDHADANDGMSDEVEFENIQNLNVNLRNGGSATTINEFPELTADGHFEVNGGSLGTGGHHFYVNTSEQPVGTVALNSGHTDRGSLYAANRPNDWHITNRGEGTLNTNISFDGIVHLYGNNQQDTFDFEQNGHVWGTIDGGEGSNSMHLLGRNDLVDNVVINRNFRVEGDRCRFRIPSEMSVASSDRSSSS